MMLTYRFRLKDKHAADLNRTADAVNLVWKVTAFVQGHGAWRKICRGERGMDYPSLLFVRGTAAGEADWSSRLRNKGMDLRDLWRYP
jgi:hypothetical protein